MLNYGFYLMTWKKDGIIIQKINLRAKIYLYKFINNDNKIKITIKSKRMPKRYLTQQFFLEESGKVTILNSFAKVFNKPTSKEIYIYIYIYI
jgi:hypothetical protein